jgi:hypothetical protein
LARQQPAQSPLLFFGHTTLSPADEQGDNVCIHPRRPAIKQTLIVQITASINLERNMPMHASFQSYPKYKYVIVGLLTLNVFIFACYDTLTAAIDALVWLVLLVLYELQTSALTPSIGQRLQPFKQMLIVTIAAVFIRYLQVSEWLNVINDLLWFALIALLETEARWPDKVLQFSHSYWLATVLVFMGLIGMVVAWVWQSAWLDVYDASLWIIAFGSIEADIFQLLQRKQA